MKTNLDSEKAVEGERSLNLKTPWEEGVGWAEFEIVKHL